MGWTELAVFIFLVLFYCLLLTVVVDEHVFGRIAVFIYKLCGVKDYCEMCKENDKRIDHLEQQLQAMLREAEMTKIRRKEKE